MSLIDLFWSAMALCAMTLVGLGHLVSRPQAVVETKRSPAKRGAPKALLAAALHALTAGVSAKPAEVPAAVIAPKKPIEHQFRIADAIHLIAFGTEWSVTLRVYQETGTVSRVLRCTNANLVGVFRKVYRREVIAMSDVPLVGRSVEDVMDQTVGDAAKLLEMVFASLKDADPDEAYAFAEVPLQREDVIARIDPVQQPPSIIVETPRPSEVLDGDEYQVVGKVVKAGMVDALMGSGQMFEVQLESAQGQMKAFRGVDLQREADRFGIKVGDRITLTTRTNPAAAQDKRAPRKLFEIANG